MGIRRYILFLLTSTPLLFINTPVQADSCSPSCSSSCVQETENYRIHASSRTEQNSQLAKECESWRAIVLQRLGIQRKVTSWRPKCDIHLFDQPAEFSRHSGLPPDALAAAQLEIGDGRVWQRRINIRADQPQRVLALLHHEIIHVVLADRFPWQRIPSWADEGLAVLFESPQRLASLIEVHRSHASLVEHTRFNNSLSGASWRSRSKMEADVYYARSALLARYLIKRSSPNQFLNFLDQASVRGLPSALRSQYGLHRLPSLDELLEETDKSLAWSPGDMPPSSLSGN